MSRLEEVLELRKQIQRQYLEIAQEIWNSDLETCKKDSKARKEYELYRSKDRVLERIQAMEESIIEDLEYYNKKYSFLGILDSCLLLFSFSNPWFLLTCRFQKEWREFSCALHLAYVYTLCFQTYPYDLGLYILK